MSSTAISIVDAMDDPQLFRPWFEGPTWSGWRTVLKAAYGLPMTGAERLFFRSIADREPPAKRVRELWIAAGRRAGKDSVASVIAAHAAALFDQQHRLRPGERGLVACLAVDRDQARIVLKYIRSFFTDIPLMQGMVTRSTASGFELSNQIDVAVATNSFRSTRGRPIVCAIFDEVSYWRDETSATPDEETYRAIVPGTATVAGAMVIGISSPYRRAGLLYRKYRDHYGRDGDVLVIKAPSIVLNPTLDQAIIDQALADDPAAARSEWLAEFRDDIDNFVTRETVDAAMVPGRFELPPIGGQTYCAFVDPSGGASDSMTLGIAHVDAGQAVLDLVRERRPPFSPEDVVEEFAAALKAYGVTVVHGDRYAGEWPRERFRVHGIEYEPAEKPKSDLYRDFLPAINSGRIELLDIPRLTAQLVGLERRTARGGRDSIDHAPGAHDDVANAAVGSLVMATARNAPRLTFGSVSTAAHGMGRRSTYGIGNYLNGELRQ